MQITVNHRHVHHFELGPELEGLLVSIIKGNAMISKQVQDALDRIHATQSLVGSVKAGLDLQSGQIATLTQAVSDLQAKLDAGGTLGADDIAGLTEISNDIDTVNAQLQSAVPANTGGNPGSTGSGVGSSGGTTSSGSTSSSGDAGNVTSGGSAQSGDPAAPPAAPPATDASAPQPMGGTGTGS